MILALALAEGISLVLGTRSLRYSMTISINFYTVITLISLLVNLFLAVLVVSKNPRRVLNLVFGWTISVLLFMEIGQFILFIRTGVNKLFWIKTTLVGACLIPANFFLLSLILGEVNPKDLLKRNKHYIIPVYLISLIFTAFVPSDLFIKQIGGKYPNYQFIYGIVGYSHLFFSLLVILATLWVLERKYRYVQNLDNNKVKFSILILIGILSFQILVQSMAIIFSYMRIDFMTVSFLTFLIANVSIAYTIISPSSQFTKIEISRDVISKSYSLLLAGLYLLVVGMLGEIIQLIGKRLNFFLALLVSFSVLTVLMIALVSSSLKKRFLYYVERNFYKSKYDYRKEWENFSRRVFSTFDLKEIFSKTVDAVSEAIKVNKSFLVVKDEDKKEYSIPVYKGSSQPDIKFDCNSEFIDWLWRYGSPLNIYTSSQEFNLYQKFQEEIKLLKHLDIYVCVPIIAQHELIAILLLGQKTASNDEYTLEDMDLLETMANQLSIAITNAKMNEELIVSREMISFQRLSTFVVHDLKNTVSMLSMVIQNAEDNFDNPEFQQDVLHTMSEAVSKMQNLITKLSKVPEELELNLQIASLPDIINKAIDSSGIRNLAQVKLNCVLQQTPKIVIDPEYIEKVILNLLLNAIEAIPEEGNVTLLLYSKENSIYLEVSDTGCGMSQEFIDNRLFKPFQTTKKKGIGIGLYQCQVIVEAHGGKIEVSSTEGIGSTFAVKLPVKLR